MGVLAMFVALVARRVLDLEVVAIVVIDLAALAVSRCY